MVSIQFNVDFLPNFYNKLNEKAFIHAEEQLIEKLTRELEIQCVREAPVRTGKLRDSHYTIIDGLDSYVGNNVDYTPYVVLGTSRQAPNNYPQRAINTVITETYLKLVFEDYLRYNGIDVER